MSSESVDQKIEEMFNISPSLMQFFEDLEKKYIDDINTAEKRILALVSVNPEQNLVFSMRLALAAVHVGVLQLMGAIWAPVLASVERENRSLTDAEFNAICERVDHLVLQRYASVLDHFKRCNIRSLSDFEKLGKKP